MLKLITFSILLTASLVASRALLPYTVTVVNRCNHQIAPDFDPPLPTKTGYGTQLFPNVPAGTSESVKFGSFGNFFAFSVPTQGRNAHTTVEFETKNGIYDISLEHGFNYALSVQLIAKSEVCATDGQYCDKATCNSPRCPDASQGKSGILDGSQDPRTHRPDQRPNHLCPVPSFEKILIEVC